MKTGNRLQFGWVAGALLALTACNQNKDADPDPQAEPTPSASASPVSIIRAELEEAKELPLTPLELIIGFPDGGAELDEEARTILQTVLESPQYSKGGAIVLRGHSDTAGSDEANLRASVARAEAVRDHLIEAGASEDRVTIIAIGEQNPIEPNAMSDGSPNETGRAANRRVEITILVPDNAGAAGPDE